MNVTRKIIILLTVIILLAFPLNSFAYTYNIVFQNVPPVILNWSCPVPASSTWPGITSKWNQPRDTGTNPHQGVDVGVAYDTEVYAVWNGWLSHLWSDTTGHAVSLLIDANNNGIKDDPTYYCRYYHLKEYGTSGYYYKGDLIGRSGYPSAPHLHFGGVTSTPQWYRNEVQYRWTSQ